VVIHSRTGDARFAPADSPAGTTRAPDRSADERIAALVRDAVLCRQPDCPVCGSTQRHPEENTARDNRYIRAIPLVTPLGAAEVVDVLRAWRCANCTSVYCDPWLSRATSARLYTTGFGQHFGGWQILHRSVANAAGETHAHWQERTWAQIVAIAGPVSVHAELNCPFSGLLTYFRPRELGGVAYRRLARRSRRAVRARRRTPYGPAAMLRRVFESRRAARPVEASAQSPEFPAERVLVLEPSAACWGNNCVSQGVTCQSLAGDLLGASLATTSDLVRDRRRFDVAVLTQLDHFLEPMDVLERFLDRSGLVVVASHLANYFSKQHPFSFGPGAAEHFRSRGWSAVDFTAETVHPAKRSVNQCVFVSKQIRI
jgi:hypothetical protein